MRKLFFYISLATTVCFATEVSAQKTVINEFYYEVNKKGEVNKTSILEEQTLVHYPNKGLISIYNSGAPFRIKDFKTESTKYLNLPDCNKKNPDCKYDDNNRIIEWIEKPNEEMTIHHFYTYNKQGDPVEDKYILTNSKGVSTPEVILTYDYIYLDDFAFHDLTFIEAGGKKFISGTTPNYTNSWIKRLTKKDGVIVQYAERKIKKRK